MGLTSVRADTDNASAPPAQQHVTDPMTFDDQLRRAFDTLSDRLRDELERQVHAAMDELAASAREERDAAIAAAAAEREAALQSAEAAREAARSAEAERQAALQAAATARQTALESARAEHDAALRALEADRDAAIAAAHADRDAAVAAAEAEREAAVAAAAASAVAAAPSDNDALVAHLSNGVRAMSQASSLTAVLQALMTAAGASGANGQMWLVRGHELQPWRHDSSSAPLDPIATDADNPIAEAARSKAPARRDEVVALPLTLAGEVVAVLVTASQQSAPNADALEVLALYASRAIESITAFKTARALTGQPDRSDAVAHDSGAADNRGHAGGGAINAEDMATAQRYARLRVSEIKLYHEAEVVEGRRDRDLATRLGGEIARARVMYEQRVPAHVRSQSDYFHDELVRTLANGDPALLEVRR